ncbi:MAG TPA: hypothetical protein GXZ53_09160 [Firmicutes bacterium]|jgi:hypothetical protein|nr:hypothetical protein [Bacillota bacterium]
MSKKNFAFITPDFAISMNIRRKNYGSLLLDLYALRTNEEMNSDEKAKALQSLLKEDSREEDSREEDSHEQK